MLNGLRFSSLTLFFLYLLANLGLIAADAPLLAYPSLGVSCLFIMLLIQWVFAKQNEARDTVELTLTKTVPNQRLINELDMAKRVQSGLLSVESPAIPGIQIVKRCLPAERVGGDFYTFISQDFSTVTPKKKSEGIIEYYDTQHRYLGVVIGDVAGHGVSSALIMALSSGLLSELGRQAQSPAETLFQANHKLMRYMDATHITHVTAFYGILNTHTLEFKYACAGHPPAIHISKDSDPIECYGSGPIMGMFEVDAYKDYSIQLSSGDRLLCYTDGITETKAPSGELFGTQRLQSFLKAHSEQPIGHVVNQLFDSLDQYSQFQKAKDDRTVVLLEVE